jgi:DNA-binding CsgD family transcriptional regulator
MKAVLSTRATATREAIAAMVGQVHDPLELLDEVRTRVRRIVPNGGGAWMLTDPQTLMPTALIQDSDMSAELGRRFFEHELFVPDFSAFSELHRRGVVVTTLGDATNRRMELSPRYRELHQPNGLGDELRTLFRTGDATWGFICVSRAADEPSFDEAERAWMRDVAADVGRGLRAAFARPPAEPGPAWAPGMLVLDDRGEIEYATGEARRWLAHMPQESGWGLPNAVLSVALQARAEARAGGSEFPAPAQARLRLRTGAWLYVHAAALRDADGTPARIAVMLEPADRAQLLSLLVHVHGLTERERQVTELLLTGLPTEDIAQRMSISRHTVRDHVKAIFAKVGVVSRPELTARFLPELA